MPQSIPAGLTTEHILKALADLDAGVDHLFGEPTGYELVHEEKRYPPKAVVGLACRYSLGQVLKPDEFSGGESAGQANFVLRGLGLTIEQKSETAPVEVGESIQNELRLRMKMWERLREKGGPSLVAPSVLRDLGIYGGAQGIWVDKARTSLLTSDGKGITVGVLHTGSSYADDLSEDCIIYHYPQTRRPAGRDTSEVEATKAASHLQLPLFVITYPTSNSTFRDVQLAWVESWDDKSQTFLISFGEESPTISESDDADRTQFVLSTSEPRARRTVHARSGQQRFKFRVFQRYGPQCAVCGLALPELLDAAHIRPKQEDGSDDPRNGIVLCANHHRAFDAGLFAIEPATLEIRCPPNGPDSKLLSLRFGSIAHLAKRPHTEALSWLWNAWEGCQKL